MFQNQKPMLSCSVVPLSEKLTFHLVGSFIVADCHLTVRIFRPLGHKTGVIVPDHLGETKGGIDLS